MFQINTYRWDYAQIAALVAPRPLLILNTDSDSIFPLDGVIRVFIKFVVSMNYMTPKVNWDWS